MSHATSELTETRNARLKGEPAARTPAVGDRIIYRQWDLEARAYVERRGEITEVVVSDRIGTPTTISATILTPSTASGTLCVRGITQGGEPEQWDFA